MRYLIILLFTLASQLSAVEEIKEREVLVTGCARSGTRYMAYVLRDCGLDVGHEWVMADGLVSWLMCADCKTCPWGADPSEGWGFQHIFHQVRDPLKVIASVFANEPPASWEFICTHLPQIKPSDSHMVKCAKYWYYWNLMAEQKAEYTYRIEDVDDALEEMGHRLGRELQPRDISAYPKDLNTRRKPPHITWETLGNLLPRKLFEDIQEMAIRYGYSIE